MGVTNGVVSVNIDKKTIKLDAFNTLYVDPLTATIPATTTRIGGIIVGQALSAGPDGKLDVRIDNNTIKIDGANQLYVAAGGSGGGTTSSFTLNDGTSDLVGVDTLTVGTGLNLDSSGTLTLPIASTSQLGGVKVGASGAIDKAVSGLISVGVDNTSIKINGSNQLTFEPNALSTVFINTLAQNGGINIAGIATLLWGKASFSSGTTFSVTGMTFKSTCYSVVATQASGTTPVAVRVSGVTRSGFTLNIATAATMDFYWLAVGDS